MLDQAEAGLEVNSIRGNAEFANRKLHRRDPVAELLGMRRIARAFVDRPETILQELVNAAVELCGADSAGISLQRQDGTPDDFYHWVATAGEYSGFLDARLPQWPSACSICLERGTPQQFRVHQRFFDILGITAPLVTDAILLPWQVGDTRGTIFILAHGRTEAFDLGDCNMMEALADFAAMGVRQLRLQETIVAQARTAAAVAMATRLAHEINNPLQCLTNMLFLASEGHYGAEGKELGDLMFVELQRLSTLVAKLLELPLEP
jgi:transcriptional regulator with GAF, ATPase, and Fis domain